MGADARSLTLPYACPIGGRGRGCLVKVKTMKRAHQERLRTVRVWRQHLCQHGPGPLTCPCEFQIGRFREGQRVGGCGKTRCYLCHGDKLLKRPTLPQRWSDLSYQEWLCEGG